MEVKNAGTPVNNPESQGSPALHPDGVLYFSSLSDKSAKKEEGIHFAKLYSSEFEKDKGWGKPSELPEIINREGYHSTNVSFSKDGNTMFFNRILSEGGHMDESKIYLSTRTASGWSPAIEATGVNGEFIARHPVEGELFGNTVLFFSSDMQGGKGGFDLYYANKTGEGQYSDPINLADLNSAKDEITPYYHEGKMYFSSDGWPGIGGFDVFLSTWNGAQ